MEIQLLQYLVRRELPAWRQNKKLLRPHVVADCHVDGVMARGDPVLSGVNDAYRRFLFDNLPVLFFVEDILALAGL